MGADNFTNVLIGKDLGKAFAEAQRQAAWEHGHGGYTGTIAEKPGFTNLGPLPARMSVDRLEELIFAQFEHHYQVENHREFGGRKPGKNPVPEQWRAFVTKAAGIYDDKWGPALVVELTGTAKMATKQRHGRGGTQDKVWVAMGMASSWCCSRGTPGRATSERSQNRSNGSASSNRSSSTSME
jgi:hypothetical protein